MYEELSQLDLRVKVALLMKKLEMSSMPVYCKVPLVHVYCVGISYMMLGVCNQILQKERNCEKLPY